MAKQTQAQLLEESFIGIRDEYRLHKNTAFRIGTAFLDLLRFAQIGEFDEITFNKVLNHPTFLKGLTTLGPIFFGQYAEGLKGGKITEEGIAELQDLWVRRFTKLGDGLSHVDDMGKERPALEVQGDSVFSGNLSSPNFISGFPYGVGWAIQKKEFVNAAGETEYKYILECDGANIRGTLRVYEFVMSQLLGENDNRIFTAMEEVHHYDPKTGKVWLRTNGGKFVMPFRKDDCIMVQQYQPGNDVSSGGDGYITKSYELRIKEVGTGGMTDENGDRLDWVTFRDFATMMEDGTPEDLIADRDTFCRVDNVTDPERKGIIQMMTVGTNAPYMDIIYGMKTDPDNALKGRLGNLQGIHHHLFGWLKDFGEYLINAYIVGDVRLRRTGESLDTAVQILKGLVATKIAETMLDVTDSSNYLRNAEFTELDADGSFRYWKIDNDDISFFSVGGEPVLASVGTVADVRQGVKTVMLDGSQVLHIIDGSVKQSCDVMKQPGTHKEYDYDDERQVETYQTVRDSLYMNLRIRVIRPGTLTVGFPRSVDNDPSALMAKTRYLERTGEWLTLQWEGTWDGISDFVLAFDGECYVTGLSITDEPLASFKSEYSTQFRQTSKNISLIASQTNTHESNIASLQVEARRISGVVENNVDGLVKKVGDLTITATNITGRVKSVEDSVNGTTGTKGLLTRMGEVEVTANSVSNRVSVIEGAYVKQAEMSVYIKDEDGVWISHAKIQADNIDFHFTKNVSFYANGTEVMNLSPQGNLWIKGEYRGGKISGDISIGSGTYKLMIRPNNNNGADLVGYSGEMTAGNEIIKLGFQSQSDESNTYIMPYFNLRNGYTGGYKEVLMNPRIMRFHDYVSGAWLAIGTYPTIGNVKGFPLIQSASWPTWETHQGSLMPGMVYKTSDGYLKVV